MSTKRKIQYGIKEMERDFGPLTFAKVLLAHRESEELTQTQMSRKLGISKQSLCDLEKGRRIPSPRRAANIAKKLKMIPESFIELAIQDQLRAEKLYYDVSIEKSKQKAS